MSPADFHPDIPSGIARSPIFSAGGVLYIPGLLDADTFAALRVDAAAARPLGRRNELAVSDGAEGRGGSPARALTTAQGGDLQWQLFGGSELVAALTDICGVAVSPIGGGSYSYYEQPGDFLALHRDIVTCDVTLIVCVEDRGTASGGGALLVYPQFVKDPLSRVRAAGPGTATPVRIEPGESIVLLGGVVPHEVTPMQAGQERVVSVMCYRVTS